MQKDKSDIPPVLLVDERYAYIVRWGEGDDEIILRFNR